MNKNVCTQLNAAKKTLLVAQSLVIDINPKDVGDECSSEESLSYLKVTLNTAILILSNLLR